MENKRVNTKAKGNRRERQAKKSLEEQGYLVTKAGGSLGIWDLVGLKVEGLARDGYYVACCIQVKSNRMPGKEEMKRLNESAKRLYPDVCCEIWIYKDYQREPIIINLRKENRK